MVQEGQHSEFEFTDEAVEIALQTGEHADLLKDYFGAETYAELRSLAQGAAARGLLRGPKVWILPGIMGSKIGRESAISSLFDDVYWFDPIDIAAGALTKLRLTKAPSRYSALGVILLAYLKLKLRLKRQGFDASFYPFDWRQSIDALGRELAARLDDEGSEISLVCHSMGGLVARSALGSGAKVKRLIMLGTPNYGSFVPVLALRATYSVVRKVAALDLEHTAEQLATRVFSTFPGLTQMLPAPEKFDDVDLYDVSQWPAGKLRPRPDLLDGVKEVRKRLARGDGRFFLIAGAGEETVTGLRRDDGEFAYEYTREGDGTVPLDMARLPRAKTYYVEESHGSLPNNRAVAEAVGDLLERAATDRLPQTWEPSDRAAVETRSDSDLRIDPYENRRGAGLSRREIRHLLDEVAAPTARDQVSLAAPAAVPVEGGYVHRLDHVVVGRSRRHRLDLFFARGSITEVDAEALAFGLFRDVAPGGAANAVDRELDGAITEFTKRRMFSGNVGEIVMLPTGRHRLMAEVVAFVGLGLFDRFSNEVLEIAAENVIRTFIKAKVREFATVLIGSGSGESPASSLRSMARGFLRGLADADRSHEFRRVIICEWDEERYRALKSELYRLSSTDLFDDFEVTFNELDVPAPRPIAEPDRRPRPSTKAAYLIVRQERRTRTEIDMRSSILTAGAKATVVTGVRTLSPQALDAWLDRVDHQQGADFSDIGGDLAELVLAPEVLEVLPTQKDCHLVVVHDAPSSRIPWETLAIAGSETWYPAAEKGLSHRYAADNLSVAKWLEERVEDAVFRVLLIVNPTGDLAGTVAEARAMKELLEATPGARWEELRGSEATRAAVMAAFGSGTYDVIHYAGHAFFDPRNPERSGLLCHGKVTLSGTDLAGLGNLPTLVFFNACESARVRSRDELKPETRARRFREDVHDGVGAAEALMRGGVTNFVGTYWPVGDAPAADFAQAFYRELLEQRTVNDALRAGRAAVIKLDSRDWADYIHYGDPDFVVKDLGGP